MTAIQSYTGDVDSIEEIYEQIQSGESVTFIAKLISDRTRATAEIDTDTTELVVTTDNGTSFRFGNPDSPTDLHNSIEHAIDNS